MSVSYNGLWKLLIDKNMKKVDLINDLGISSSTIAKMTKGEKVSMNILEKICDELDCDFGDIIHYEKNKDGGNNELQCRYGVSGICICRDETDSRTYGMMHFSCTIGVWKSYSIVLNMQEKILEAVKTTIQVI